jgi:prepilin-type N-terminal cleavage/methylation domain-containing protein
MFASRQFKGFTLAEVLITLSIIGVVAALTIAPLKHSYDKTVIISRYKKVYSELNQVANYLKADYGSVASASSVGNANFQPIWTKYLKVVENCDTNRSYESDWYDKCWHADGTSYDLDGRPHIVGNVGLGAVTADGMIILAFMSNGYCETGTDTGCGKFTVDINGMKGPNKVGIDIFQFLVNDRHVVPYADDANDNYCKIGSGASEDYAGWTCGGQISTGRYNMGE